MIRLNGMLLGLVCALLVSGVDATEPAEGQISNATLASIGLAELEPLSDDDGHQIRGQGAVAFGFSSARFFWFTQVDDYNDAGFFSAGGTSSASIGGSWAAGGSFAIGF